MTSLFNKIFLQTTFSRLLLLFILLAGLGAASIMVKENNPDLEIPQMVISVEWDGASPGQIEKEVINKVEQKVKAIKGLKNYSSGSFNSFGVVTVEFDADESLAVARQRLNTQLSEAAAEFPQGVGSPKVEEVSVGGIPILGYMLSGDIDEETLTEVSEAVKKRLERLKGVKKVELAGDAKKSVQIRLYSERLHALGINPVLVQNRISQSNMDSSWGSFEVDQAKIDINLLGRFDDIERLKNLPIIKISDNRTVRLKEIGEVYIGLDKKISRSQFSSQGSQYVSGINMSVYKRSGVDTLLLIDLVEQEMARIKASSLWPGSMSLAKTSDESEQINQALNDMVGNMWQATVLVFLILLVILTWREAILAGLAIPLTFLASLILLFAFDFTINSIVLIGMVLALGMLVDVFILVMEGMNDSLNNLKLSMNEAIKRTVKSYALPAFAGQLTTILAMAPLLFVGGIDGKFIRQIPLAAVFCLVFSFIIAFLVVLPLSRYLLKTVKENSQPKVGLLDNTMRSGSEKLYQWIQAKPLSSKKQSKKYVGFTVLAFIGSLFLASTLPSEMYPKADGRNLGITIELNPNVTLEVSQRVADLAGEYLRQQDIFSDVTKLVGAQSPFSQPNLNDSLVPSESPHIVGFSVRFTPKSERDKLAFEYLPHIRQGLEQALRHEPGWNLLMLPETGGSSAQDPVQIELVGTNVIVLQSLANEIKAALAAIPGATDVRDNIGSLRQELTMNYDQEALNYFGLSEEDVNAQLRIALQSDEVGKFKREGVLEDYPIRLSTWWPSRENNLGGPTTWEELNLLNVINNEGNTISLSLLIDYNIEQNPITLIHSEGQRAVTISSKVNERSVFEILDELTPQLDSILTNYDSSYQYRYRGEAETSADTFGKMGLAFILSIFLVFAVLTLLFNSFSQPIIILATIPFALIGVFVGFVVLGINMSFPAMIGIVSLVGIVVNNAIVMVEYINQKSREGLSEIQAAAAGALDRFRPIITTSLTTALGLIPLAVSDPMWYPLCMAIIFGLLSSTVITLVIIPCFYRLLAPAVPQE